MHFSFDLLNKLHLSLGNIFHCLQDCAMCAIKPLIKFLFDAWKLNVKNVTNEHRINGGNFFDIKCTT
jgi:hypothetical protein